MKTFQIILGHRVTPIRASSVIRPLCTSVNSPSTEYNAPYDAVVERWKAFEKEMSDVRSKKEGPLRWKPPSYKNEDFLRLQKSRADIIKGRLSKKQVPMSCDPTSSDNSQTQALDIEMLSKMITEKTFGDQNPVSINKRSTDQANAVETRPINQLPAEEFPRRRRMQHLRDKSVSETPPTEAIETQTPFTEKVPKRSYSNELSANELPTSEYIGSSKLLREILEKGVPSKETSGKLVSSKQDRDVSTGLEKDHLLKSEPSGNTLQEDKVKMSPAKDDSIVLAQEIASSSNVSEKKTSSREVPDIRGRGVTQLHPSRGGELKEAITIKDSPKESTAIEDTQNYQTISVADPLHEVNADVPQEHTSEYYDKYIPFKHVNNVRADSGKHLRVDGKNNDAIRKYIAEAEVELTVQKQMLNTQREDLSKRLRKLAMNPLTKIDKRFRANYQNTSEYFNQKNRNRRIVKKTQSRLSDETRVANSLSKNVEPISSSSQLTENSDPLPGNNIQPVNKSYQNEATVGSNLRFQNTHEYNDVNHLTVPKNKQRIKPGTRVRSKEMFDDIDDSIAYLLSKEENPTVSEEAPRKFIDRDSNANIEGSNFNLDNQPKEVSNHKMPSKRKRSTVHSKANSVRNNDDKMQSISNNVSKSEAGKLSNRKKAPTKLRSPSKDYYEKLLRENVALEQRVLTDNFTHRTLENTRTSETEAVAELKSKPIVANQKNMLSKTKHSKSDSDLYNTRETGTPEIHASQKNMNSQELIATKGSHSKENERLTKYSEVPEFIQQDTYNELQESINKKITSLVKAKMADQRGYSPSFHNETRGKLRKRFMSRSNFPKNLNKKSGYTYHSNESKFTTRTKRSLQPGNDAERLHMKAFNRPQNQKSMEKEVTLSEPYQHFKETIIPPKLPDEPLPKILNQTDQPNFSVDSGEYVPTERNASFEKKMKQLSTFKKVSPHIHSERQPLNKTFAKQQNQWSTTAAVPDQVRRNYRPDASSKIVHPEAYSPSSRKTEIPEYNYFDPPNVYARSQPKQETFSQQETSSPKQYSTLQKVDKINESYNYPYIQAVQEYNPTFEGTKSLPDGTVQSDKGQTISEPTLLSESGRNQSGLKNPFISQTANTTNLRIQRITQNNISAATDHTSKLNKSYSLPPNQPRGTINQSPKQKRYTPEMDLTSYAVPVNSVQKPMNSLHKDNQFHQYSINDGPAEVHDSVLSKKLHSQNNFRSNTTVLNNDAETKNAESLQDIEEDIASLRINLRPPVDTLSRVGKTFPATQSPKIQPPHSSSPRFRSRSLDRGRPSSAVTNKIQSVRSHSLSSTPYNNPKLKDDMFPNSFKNNETNEYRDPHFSDESRNRLRSNSLGKIDLDEPTTFTQTKTSRHEPYSSYKLFPDSEYSRTEDYFPVVNKNIPISKVPSKIVNGLNPSIPTEYKPYVFPNAGIQDEQNYSSYKDDSDVNLNNSNARFNEEIESSRREMLKYLQKSQNNHQRTMPVNPYVEPLPVNSKRDSFDSANDEFDQNASEFDATVDSQSRMIPSVQSTNQSIKYHAGSLGPSTCISDNLPHFNSKEDVISFHPNEVKALRKYRFKLHKKPETPKSKFRPRFIDSPSNNVNNFDTFFRNDESVQIPGSPIRKWKLPSQEKAVYVAHIPPNKELS